LGFIFSSVTGPNLTYIVAPNSVQGPEKVNFPQGKVMFFNNPRLAASHSESYQFRADLRALEW